MRILLTGGTGFVGSRLRMRLNTEHTVKSLVRPKSTLENKKDTVLGDLTDYDRLHQIVKDFKPEVVYHLAALTPVRESFKLPILYQQINYMGTVNLLHACYNILGNDFRFIMASTAEVYGENGQEVKREEQKLAPMSPYAVSKMAADKYIRMCGKAYGLETVILRCNNTYGRPYSGYFVESMMEKLKENKLCDLYYANNSRDYMWVGDHVNAYMLVLDKGCGIYNVAPGELITNIGMVRLMKEVIGSKSEVVTVDPPKSRPTDHGGINMDASLIRSLGWKPETTRIEGIQKLRAMYE